MLRESFDLFCFEAKTNDDGYEIPEVDSFVLHLIWNSMRYDEYFADEQLLVKRKHQPNNTATSWLVYLIMVVRTRSSVFSY